jgi:hypothetical protein
MTHARPHTAALHHITRTLLHHRRHDVPLVVCLVQERRAVVREDQQGLDALVELLAG